MNKPTLEIFKIEKNGKVAIEFVVRNSLYNHKLHNMFESLGYKATVDISNRRSIFCTTPAELDAARNLIAKFFNAEGEWK